MADEQEITAPLETEELQAGWAAKSNARPQCFAHVLFAAKTDLGQVRENNEDKFEFFVPDDPAVLATKGRVYAVADGMGGHSAGQVAAELALNVFIRSYYGDASDDMEASVSRAVKEANHYVVDVARTIPGRSGMGATLIVAIVRENQIFIAWVGDSRGYLLRGGGLQQVTEDHSWVAEQVRAGAMTEEEAEQSPFRNVITRSMGGAPDAEPDLTAFELLPGDRYLLCSDGLSGMVPFHEIQEILGYGSPSVATWGLVDRANQYGGRDNITAFVLHVADIVPWPPEEGEEAAATATTSLAEPIVVSNGHLHPAPEEASAPAPPPAHGEDPGGSAPKKGGLMGRIFGQK